MHAKVTTEFQGRPDGEVLARPVRVGEIIGGDLAVVAVGEGWAEPIENEIMHETQESAADAVPVKPTGELKRKRS